MKKTFLFATIFIITTVAIAQYCLGKIHRVHKNTKVAIQVSDSSQKAVKESKPDIGYTDKISDSVMCFPLQHDHIYSLYSYVIDLKDERIINRYKPIFDQNDYEFTGYAWEGILKQILSHASKDIYANTFIHAQPDLVCFTITRYPVKQELPEFICPILGSPRLLASYIRRVNRDYVDNY